MIAITTFATLLHAAEEAELDKDTVSPGVAGFIFTAILAVGVILLGLDLVRRLRRSSFREEIRIKLEAEIAERDAAAAGDAPVANADAVAKSADESHDSAAGNSDAGSSDASVNPGANLDAKP